MLKGDAGGPSCYADLARDRKAATMDTLEWVQLAFLIFLALAVTLMVLAWWIKPHLAKLMNERDSWRAEAIGYREAELRGDVVGSVKRLAQPTPDQIDLQTEADDLARFLHGAATSERHTDDT